MSKLLKLLSLSILVLLGTMLVSIAIAYGQAPEPTPLPPTVVPDVYALPGDLQPGATAEVVAPDAIDSNPVEAPADALAPAVTTVATVAIPAPPYTVDQLTPAILAAAAAALLSLIMQYMPGAANWFSTLTPIYKQWLMLVLSLIFALAITLWNIAATGSAGDQWVKLLFAMFAALTSNQVTYQYIKTPKP